MPNAILVTRSTATLTVSKIMGTKLTSLSALTGIFFVEGLRILGSRL